jgi:hypothetical protein
MDPKLSEKLLRYFEIHNPGGGDIFLINTVDTPNGFSIVGFCLGLWCPLTRRA